MKDYKQNIEKIIATERPIIINEAKRLGRFFGNECKPAPPETWDNYIQPVFKSCEVLYNTVRTEIGKTDANLKTDIEACTTVIGQLQDRRIELTKRMNVLEHSLGQSTQCSLGVLLIRLVVLFLILGADIFFNGKACQIFGLGFIASMLMGCGFSLALLVIGEIIKLTLKYCTTVQQKWLVIIGWAVFYTFIFYFLGDYRASYLKAKGGTDDISTVGYILFNILFLLGGAAIMMKLPPLQELGSIFSIAISEDKQRKVLKEITALNIKANDQDARRRQFEQELENLPWYEQDLRNLIESIAKQAVSEFISSNLQARTNAYSGHAPSYETNFYTINPKIS